MRLGTILSRTAADHGVTVADIIGHRRRAEVVAARHDAVHRLRQAGLSTPLIGRALGGRDHSTILHALAKPRPPLPTVTPFRDHDGTCDVEGCPDETCRLGMCEGHYRRWCRTLTAPRERRTTSMPVAAAVAEVDRLLASGWTANRLHRAGVVSKSAVHYWRTGKVARVHRRVVERLRATGPVCEHCDRPALGGSRWCAVGGCGRLQAGGRWSWSRNAA